MARKIHFEPFPQNGRIRIIRTCGRHMWAVLKVLMTQNNLISSSRVDRPLHLQNRPNNSYNCSVSCIG